MCYRGHKCYLLKTLCLRMFLFCSCGFYAKCVWNLEQDWKSYLLFTIVSFYCSLNNNIILSTVSCIYYFPLLLFPGGFCGTIVLDGLEVYKVKQRFYIKKYAKCDVRCNRLRESSRIRSFMVFNEYIKSRSVLSEDVRWL
jgi:uncharacterized membrane protein